MLSCKSQAEEVKRKRVLVADLVVWYLPIWLVAWEVPQPCHDEAALVCDPRKILSH